MISIVHTITATLLILIVLIVLGIVHRTATTTITIPNTTTTTIPNTTTIVPNQSGVDAHQLLGGQPEIVLI